MKHYLVPYSATFSTIFSIIFENIKRNSILTPSLTILTPSLFLQKSPYTSLSFHKKISTLHRRSFLKNLHFTAFLLVFLWLKCAILYIITDLLICSQNFNILNKNIVLLFHFEKYGALPRKGL